MDWILNANQMRFMIDHHDAIEAAYASNDVEFLRGLAASESYLAVFGNMAWDDAIDCYEMMLPIPSGMKSFNLAERKDDL